MFPVFQALFDRGKFNFPCAFNEGVVGKVLSELQRIDLTDVDWYKSKLKVGPEQVIYVMSGSGHLALLASEIGHRVTTDGSSPDIIVLNPTSSRM